MAYSVYILYSESLGSFYKGQTSNMQSRLSRHNAGYEKYTKHGCPWEIYWLSNKASRKEAVQLERKLKNLSTSRLVEFMQKYSEDLTVSGKIFTEEFER